MMQFRDQSDAWQTKVQDILWAPFPIPWIAISGALYGIAIPILLLAEPTSEQWKLLAIEATIMAALANATVYMESLLDEVADNFPRLLAEPDDKVKIWIGKWYTTIFWSRKTIIAGVFGAVAIVVMGMGVVPELFHSFIGRAYAFFFDALIGFLGGSLAWTMLGIARLTSSLGRDISIKPSIFDTATSPIRAASSVLWKVSLVGVLIYVLLISIYPICSITPDIVNIIGIMTAAIAVLIYFVVPQLNIHKALKRLKQQRLDLLVQQIDLTFDEVASGPTPTNITQLKELIELQRYVNSRKSWSFGIRELIALVSSILIPLILFGLNYLLHG